MMIYAGKYCEIDSLKKMKKISPSLSFQENSAKIFSKDFLKPLKIVFHTSSKKCKSLSI